MKRFLFVAVIALIWAQLTERKFGDGRLIHPISSKVRLVKLGELDVHPRICFPFISAELPLFSLPFSFLRTPVQARLARL
jgi:hypothetical protein